MLFRSDFSIFRLLAQHWGCGPMFARWESPAAVFEILKELSAGQTCDITGIADYAMLDNCGGVQWPFPSDAGRPAQQRRLFADGQFFHADGRARFMFDPPRPLPEPVQPRFPFTLLTGRGTASQWHTQTRTAKSQVLRKLSSLTPYVEINPYDARALGIQSEQKVWLVSQRGRIQLKAVVTPTVQAGQVFVPMHFEITNQLTHSAFDPISSQPAYKACAVRIELQDHP